MIKILFSVFVIFAVFFTSCEKDDVENTGDPYFAIEGNPTGLYVDIKGTTQSYTVRSNRPWQVVAQAEADWVRAFPGEGEDDGIFKFIVKENITFENRIMNFSIIVDGEEQPVLFRIDQEANVPFVMIDKAEDGISIPSIGEEEVVIRVNSNVDWTYTMDTNDWLIEVEVTESQIKLMPERNWGPERTVSVVVSSPEYPDLSAEITLTQASGSVILQEDFSWLEEYSTAIFYASTDAKRYESWTAEQKAKGWTSTENSFSSNETLLYAAKGTAKLGKTKYGGDMISPKLSALTSEPTDLLVTFKAVPYKTKGGTMDDNFLNISIIGPGTISQSQFIIDNWPMYPAAVEEHEAYCISFWNEPSAVRSFTIEGATSETQIKFLGGDYNLEGVGAGKNRLFIDDIKVEIKN